MEETTTPTPETVTLHVATTPIAGGDRFALEVEVEGHGHHLTVTAPEGDMTLFRRFSRELPGGGSQWTFAGRVHVRPTRIVLQADPDQFEATVTLADACELLHVLRVLESGGWRLSGDAAMEARWVAGESLEPGDFLPAAEPEAPHVEPENPHTTPATPHIEQEAPHTTPATPHIEQEAPHTPEAPVVTPEPAHAEATDPAHVEPSPVPPTPAETPEMPDPFSPPGGNQG